MNMRVIPMSDEAMALASARAALRRPEGRARDELLVACDQLLRRGTWLDAERAWQVTYRLMDEDARRRAEDLPGDDEPPPRDLLDRAADWVGGLSLMLALVGGLWAGFGAGLLP